MRLPALLALTALAAFIVPAAHAEPSLPACVGYEWCSDETGNGFAIFCAKYKSRWYCGECEACGNEPWLA